MDFYNKYPYTNFHEMNLDWLIAQVKATDKKVDDFTALNKLNWAGEWNIGNAYEQWSLVNDLDGNGYVAVVPVPRNVQITNDNYWKKIANYDSLYESFGARITALEADNVTNKADINQLKLDITKQNLVDVIYPIGSIYMSVNDINPDTILGGTWEHIKDRFLLAAGTRWENGSSGGESTHTLSTDELPAHKHVVPMGLTSGTQRPGWYINDDAWSASASNHGTHLANTTESTGKGQAHNNMPPYLAVNIWKRTA